MRTAISDVLFVFPPAPGNAGAFNSHLGVAYLRAALAREGLTTAQYLTKKPGTIDAVAADIIRRKCPIVGFTVYDSNARLSIAIAQSVKQQNPRVRVVFGGPTATFNGRVLMERHSAIDACVMGEAEETGARVFAKVLDDGALDDTQRGVAYRRDGNVISTPLSALVGTSQPGGLDNTPSPYLSGILTDGEEGVITGRGCTHRCQYCCFAALARNRFRMHSIERIVTELEYIAAQQKRTGQRFPVSVHDDAFTLVPMRAKALCQAIADRKLGLVLSCMTRADALDEELVRLMRQAGFRNISFGLESAVPSVLRATGKVRPFDWPECNLDPERQFLERVRNNVALAKKYGFRVEVSIILGLPTESPADGAATLRFVRDLRVDSYAHNFLWVFPGTPLWKTHELYGIRCGIDKTGLPETTGYSYDVKTIRPASKCHLEEQAKLAQLMATDSLFSCNVSSAAKNQIGAVILHCAELLPETADWLRNILRVGGILVQVYPQLKRNEVWSRLHRDRRVFNEHLIPARRYIQAHCRRKNNKLSDDESWVITCGDVGVYLRHKPALLTIRTSTEAKSLLDWLMGQETNVSVCDITKYLSCPTTLVNLRDRMEKLNSPSFLQEMPPPPQLKYSGRWLLGKTPCSSLSRIEVWGDAEVRPCSQGEFIGKVGDIPATLAKRLARFSRVVEQRRGCKECRNTHCPRCPFPGVDDRTYCKIMREQRRVLRVLNWIQPYSRLPIIAAMA